MHTRLNNEINNQCITYTNKIHRIASATFYGESVSMGLTPNIREEIRRIWKPSVLHHCSVWSIVY